MFNVNIPLPSALQRAAEEVQPMTEFSATKEKTRGGKEGVRNKRRGLEEEVVLSEPQHCPLQSACHSNCRWSLSYFQLSQVRLITIHTKMYLSFSIKRAPNCAKTVDANTARTSNLSNLKADN